MRIIAVKILRDYWGEFPQATQALLAWFEEVESAQWDHPNELKRQYRNASIVTDKRVVFVGMSESDLSGILGYRSRKSKILSGKRKLSLATIRKLSEVLHISAEVLIQAY